MPPQLSSSYYWPWLLSKQWKRDDDEERPWYRDPLELPSFQFSPFVAGLSSAERLNAQVRLVLTFGVVFAAFERVAAVRSLIMLLVVVVVIHLSVEHVVAEEDRREKEIYHRRRNEKPLPSKIMEAPAAAVANSPRIPSAAIHRHTPARALVADPSVEQHPLTATELIAADQAAYRQQNAYSHSQPTRFDIQNHLMGIGGLRVRMPGTEYSPMRDQGNIHPNPGPFDYGTSVQSSIPMAYTFDDDPIERMYRPVDEVDPGLVTNPLPDPTFMARLPQFDTSYEDEAVQRWREQFHSGMRFW